MRLFITDLDGTLLDDYQNISYENAKALKDVQAKGIEVIPCTGRPFLDAYNILKSANLYPNYIISSNGAMVHKSTGEKLASYPIEKKDAKLVLDYMDKNNFPYSVFTEDIIFQKDDNSKRLKDDYNNTEELNSPLANMGFTTLLELFTVENKSIVRVSNYEEILSSNKELFYIAANSFNQERLDNGRKDLSHIKSLNISSSAFHNFDATNINASKGKALEFLANYLNIELKDVVAIGDNYNDISMLEKVKYSIAMGNANKEVKNICRYTTLENYKNGVAYAIRKYVL